MSDLEVIISPRFYETDAQGHISNVTIAGWLEAARTSLLRQLLPDEIRAQVRWVVANVNIDYMQETHFGSDVTITLEGLSLGNTSLTMECLIVQEGKDCVRGRAVLVNVDPVMRTKQPVPESFRAALAKNFPAKDV